MTPSPKKIKFSPEGYQHAFLLARAVFNTRFTSKKWRRAAALLMYMCEDALGEPQQIPPKCFERFPRSEFKSELNK
jgi:hypothetical protein